MTTKNGQPTTYHQDHAAHIRKERDSLKSCLKRADAVVSASQNLIKTVWDVDGLDERKTINALKALRRATSKYYQCKGKLAESVKP